jgi:hypothetical protein
MHYLDTAEDSGTWFGHCERATGPTLGELLDFLNGDPPAAQLTSALRR